MVSLSLNTAGTLTYILSVSVNRAGRQALT